MLKYASRFSFKRIVGVELSPLVAGIAQINMERLHLNNRVEIIQANAAAYNDFEGIDCFYFFNPFPKDVFEQVMKNIDASLKCSPRKVYLVYYRPLFSAVIDNRIGWKLSDVIQTRIGIRMAKDFPVKIYTNIQDN